jgi:hypothetical protein
MSYGISHRVKRPLASFGWRRESDERAWKGQTVLLIKRTCSPDPSFCRLFLRQSELKLSSSFFTQQNRLAVQKRESEQTSTWTISAGNTRIFSSYLPYISTAASAANARMGVTITEDFVLQQIKG